MYIYIYIYIRMMYDIVWYNLYIPHNMCIYLDMYITPLKYVFPLGSMKPPWTAIQLPWKSAKNFSVAGDGWKESPSSRWSATSSAPVGWHRQQPPDRAVDWWSDFGEWLSINQLF